MKITGGFPKLLEEGGVTAKVFKGVIQGKYGLLRPPFASMGGSPKKNSATSIMPSRTGGKQVIHKLKSGELGGTVMTIEGARAYLNALKNLEPIGFSLDSATKDFPPRPGCRAGNPYDNAAMESFMATYKRECVGLAEAAGGYATRTCWRFFRWVGRSMINLLPMPKSVWPTLPKSSVSNVCKMAA